MQILIHPHPALLIKCKRSVVSQKTINQMFIVLGQSGGVALAANQVGLDTHLFVTLWGQVFQNIVIYDYSEEMEIDEGCLSLPGKIYKRKRFACIDTSEGMFFGTQAFVIQHEMDHLNGKLPWDLTNQEICARILI
jgi:peptide deformylase